MLSGFYLHYNLTKCSADRMEETKEKAFQASTCWITTSLELLSASKLQVFHTGLGHHSRLKRKNNCSGAYFPVHTIKHVFRTQWSQA